MGILSVKICFFFTTIYKSKSLIIPFLLPFLISLNFVFVNWDINSANSQQ